MLKEEEMKSENESLRKEIHSLKDDRVMKDRLPLDSGKKSPQAKAKQKSQYKNEQSEDYDFWSMPQNASYVSQKKNNIADSGLWANQKDIEESMFITQEETKGRRWYSQSSSFQNHT